MHRWVTVLLQREEQPADEVWERAGELVHDLTEQGITPVSTTRDVAVSYTFPKEDDERLRRLLEEFERAHAEWGLTWRDRRVRGVDPDDFQTADLLLVVGADLDDGFGRFLLNPSEAIGSAERCGTCDRRRPWARPLVEVPQVDGRRLRRPAELPMQGSTETKVVAPREHWDLATLPNFAVAASRRLLDALQRHGARGWTARPVRGVDGGEAGDIALLEATTAGGTPCFDHSGLDDTARCSECRQVHKGRAPSLLSVPRSAFADVDVMSAGPLPHGPLLIRRELVDRLVADDIAGIVPIEPRNFCDC